jgi:hypothetical protein
MVSRGIRAALGRSVPLDLLQQSQCYSPEEQQNDSRARKAPQPDKILYQSRMRLPTREVQTQLTKGPKVRIEE